MNKKGFTLIELVVAIAVMGVVMVIALPTINTYTGDNDKKKFVAYEKTLKSAAKLYTDAYDEDLFGYKNTGCQIVTYDDLKGKKLIEDIQIKNVTCEPANTLVYVYKDKNSNHAYYSAIKCRDTKKNVVVYSNSERAAGNCKIEDGNGPTVQLTNEQNITNPIDKPYNNGKIYGLTQLAPSIKITISDSGVGLKPGYQNLKYQWYKKETGSSGFSTVSGTNSGGKVSGINPSSYYTGSITSKIPVPQADIYAAGKDTYYTVKVTGTLVDINNNTTTVNVQPPYNDGPSNPDTAYDVEKHSKCPTITFKQANGSNASTSAWYNTNKNKITMTIKPVTGNISKFNAKEYRMFYNFKANSSANFDANASFTNYDLHIPINTNTTKAVGSGFNGKLVWRSEFYKKDSTVRHDCGRTGVYHFDHNNPKITVSISGETGKAEDGGTGYKNSITFNVSCSDQTSTPHLVFDNKNKGTSFSKKYDDRVKSKTFSVKCIDQAGNQDTYSKTFRIIKKEASCKHCGVKTYNTCRDKSFGCELHKRSSVCTCNTWASCRIPACKCQKYKTKKVTEKYGCSYVIHGSNSLCRKSGYSGCTKTYRHEGGTSTTYCSRCTCTRTKTVTTNTCDTWKKCQHKDCGCALYNRCAAAPCEKYYAKAKAPCSCKVGKTCWY